MRTSHVPALIMLSAGLVDCIIGLSKHMQAVAFVRQLAIVLLIFYFIGSVVKLILDKSISALADKKTEEKKEAGTNGDDSTVKEKK